MPPVIPCMGYEMDYTLFHLFFFTSAKFYHIFSEINPEVCYKSLYEKAAMNI